MPCSCFPEFWLEVILGFKWLRCPPSLLYDLLLGVVLLCSVATGYLDSALLSLCSQYSSKMQAYLQIGLGDLALRCQLPAGVLVLILGLEGICLKMRRRQTPSMGVYWNLPALDVVFSGCQGLFPLPKASDGPWNPKRSQHGFWVTHPLPLANGTKD